MQISHLRHTVSTLGAKPCHISAILRAWSQAKSLTTKTVRPEAFFPQAVFDTLPSLFEQLNDLARIESQHPGEDGSQRLLLRLGDGQTIESVLLPRNGLCVSTQVGCAVGCTFCMTGRSGLIRQLSSAEIVAQVALARSLHKVDKVVFMGMGEPAHNMDNVLEAMALLGNEGGIGHKKLVFSTVGDRRVFEALPKALVKPALAISLHSTLADKRTELLPKAQAIPPEELVELAETYARATGFPIQYQWTLLAGVNDGDDELVRLAQLLKGKHAVLNFINYNTIADLDYRCTPWDRANEMNRYLYDHGILSKLRRSAGQDVDGGCGQLRARHASAGGR